MILFVKRYFSKSRIILKKPNIPVQVRKKRAEAGESEKKQRPPDLRFFSRASQSMLTTV